MAGAPARLRRPASPTRREQKQIAAIVGKLYEAFVALRRDALRDQPADRDPGRRGQGARLEVHGRRQRALPPSRHRRDARHDGGRPARGARAREARHLREARRRGRRARERRRAVDVDGRRRHVRRRPAGQLLRPRRRRRRAGRGRRALGDHPRSAGEGDLLQHLRRHHALRRGRARDPAGARRDGDRAADRRPPRRHERRGRAPDPRRRGAARTCTSRRRCSRPPPAPWSWRHDRRLERARRAVPRRATRTARGPTST